MYKNHLINILIPAFDDAEINFRKRRVIRFEICARSQHTLTPQPLYDV
jgi:hypothetical protein